jgi:hypothetical protein
MIKTISDLNGAPAHISLAIGAFHDSKYNGAKFDIHLTDKQLEYMLESLKGFGKSNNRNKIDRIISNLKHIAHNNKQDGYYDDYLDK